MAPDETANTAADETVDDDALEAATGGAGFVDTPWQSEDSFTVTVSDGYGGVNPGPVGSFTYTPTDAAR